MPALRSIRQALGHLNPVLLDAGAALILFGSMAVKLGGHGHLPAGQHATTPLDSLTR